MPKRFARQYHFDTDVEGTDDKGWSEPEYFDNIADLYVEVQDLWNCEEFSMELETWCEQANIGDVFEDDDIRVTLYGSYLIMNLQWDIASISVLRLTILS